MADNATLNAGSGGVTLALASLTFSGDTAAVQVIGNAILSGSEGSWTLTQISGDAGAADAGTQRVVLASDDPAVALLTTMDVDTSAIALGFAAEGTALGSGVLLQGDDGTDRTNVLVDTSGHLQVDVLSGGGGTAYTEDVATANPIVGTAIVMERDDTIATLTPVEGDWAALRCSAEGALWVQDFNSDAALALLGTIDADTSKITACNTGAVVVASGAITETNSAALAVVGGGAEATALRVTIANDSTGVVTVDDGAGALTVDWAGTAPPIGAGTEAAALRVTLATDSTGVVSVDDNGSALTVDNGGTFVVQEDGAALTALQLIDDTVLVLGTATYTEAASKGNLVGAVRNDDLATLADTDNEVAPLQVNANGALYVCAAASEEKRASGVAAGGAPGTDDIIAAVADRKIRILALALFATSATTNNVFLDNADNDLLFNTGNPLPLSIDADGDTVAGFVLPYNPGGWCESDTVNEAITLNTSAAQDIGYAVTYIEVL